MTLAEVGTARGEVRFGSIRVAEICDASAVEIPVAVIHGDRDGPRLWVQNGVHGDEYVGLGAIQRLLQEVHPSDVSGTIIAIPIVNILAYRARARSAPQDGMDMNRIWPGNPIETAMHISAHTEIVTNALFHQIRAHADVVVDCHDGSTLAKMAPYVLYYTGEELWERRCRELAFATGMKIVWKTPMRFVEQKFPGSIMVEMSRLAIPSVTLEVGGQGRLLNEDVSRMYVALMNILRHLGMLPGDLEVQDRQLLVSRGNWLRAARGGVFWPKVDALQVLRKGEIFGVVTDLFGRAMEELIAPVDGVVIGVRTLGTVNSGEYCGNVGVIET